MAVVLPLLLTLTFGTIEVTNAIYLQQSLKIAAYEGCRVALVRDSGKKEVEYACKRILDARRIKNATVEITPANFASRPYGTAIRVTCKAALADNLISPAWVLGDRIASASVTMMKEQ